MKFQRLLAKALLYTSPLRHHHHLLHPRILIQSSLYSTTTPKLRKSPKKKEESPKPQPSVPVPKEKEWDRPLDGLNVVEESPTQDESFGQVKKEWARPSEIPWQAKVANSVNLVGYVALPIQFKVSNDGKSWAGTILSQDKLPNAPLWIPVVFEGDLAHVAACHLKEMDFVHVAGQLTADPPQFTMEQGQPNIQVLAHSLNIVQETLQMKECSTSIKQKEVTTITSEKDSNTKELWIDLLANPHDWWDNRSNKSNPKDPDFKHKDNGELWINDSTQAWIISKLEFLNFLNKAAQKNPTSVTAPAVKDMESSWRNLVDNPDQWWDYRKKKLSGQTQSKHPDFKDKDGSVSLWLNRAPAWVLSKLEEAEKASTAQDLWIDLLTNPHDWWDNRLNKSHPRNPDFKHKDNGELWIDDSTQQSIISKLDSLNFRNKGVPKNQKSVNGVKDLDSSWRHYLDNPDQWWDNRKDKLSGKIHSKFPDFKSKDSGVALWLDGAPEWVLLKLGLKLDKPTTTKTVQRKNTKENSWKDLVENPNKWWDCRSDKQNPKAPDFKHKDSKEALWLNTCPPFLLPKLPPVKAKVTAFKKIETLLS